MSDPHNPVPADAHPDLTIDLPGNGCLTIDAAHDLGRVVLDVKTYIEPQEVNRGSGMMSLGIAEMVTIRNYLATLIRNYLATLIDHVVEESRDLLADPEATEENRAAARRILAAVEDRP